MHHFEQSLLNVQRHKVRDLVLPGRRPQSAITGASAGEELCWLHYSRGSITTRTFSATPVFCCSQGEWLNPSSLHDQPPATTQCNGPFSLISPLRTKHNDQGRALWRVLLCPRLFRAKKLGRPHKGKVDLFTAKRKTTSMAAQVTSRS
jgi:hypothetical protein